MNININKVKQFAEPYYTDKDIMHNMWHINLVIKYIDKILSAGHYDVDYEALICAAYFHGFIYSHEKDIVVFLSNENIDAEKAQHILTIARESQRLENPETLEGKILHDAHVIEGGKLYMLTKCLVTGSVRGQTLLETIGFIEKNIIDANKCYLPDTIPLCVEANQYMKDFIKQLKHDILSE